MQAQWPKVVWDYFHEHASHPIIAQVYKPGVGWKRYSGIKHVSITWLRKLKSQGYTHVALTQRKARGVNTPPARTADFSIAEIIKGGLA
jgi:hypothetical protein